MKSKIICSIKATFFFFKYLEGSNNMGVQNNRCCQTLYLPLFLLQWSMGIHIFIHLRTHTHTHRHTDTHMHAEVIWFLKSLKKKNTSEWNLQASSGHRPMMFGGGSPGPRWLAWAASRADMLVLLRNSPVQIMQLGHRDLAFVTHLPLCHQTSPVLCHLHSAHLLEPGMSPASYGLTALLCQPQPHLVCKLH